MSDLRVPEPPVFGLVTHNSIELIWEDALELANRNLPVHSPDNRTKVFLLQLAVGWSDNWEVIYRGYGGKYQLKNLSPLNEYSFKIQFVASDGQRSGMSKEVSVRTVREPMHGNDIHKALILRKPEKLKTILEKREAPIDGLLRYGLSPLMHAANDGMMDMVKILLEYGAMVDLQNDMNKTALMLAAFAGRLNVVKVLRSHGASYQLIDRGGSTALHWACDSNNAQLVDWMLKDGADVNVPDANGYTPLIRVAALNGSKDLIAVLVQHKASINAVDKTSKTALILAALHGNADIVEVLLDNKADTTVKNKYGKTAYDMALAFDRKVVVKYLEKYSSKTK